MIEMADLVGDLEVRGIEGAGVNLKRAFHPGSVTTEDQALSSLFKISQPT